MTGASGGVGAGIARRLGDAGADVVVHYRCGADGAAAVVDAMGAAGNRAIAARAELLDRAALLSEPTRFQRYGIGSPMRNECCRATRPPAARVIRNVP
jgi:3-oxoacyl-[acyl-carrier protein] reductase